MLDKTAAYGRNTIVFLMYRAISRLYFYLPVLVVYFMTANYDFLDIGLLLSSYSVTVIVLEYPTQALINRIGAKVTIIAGEILKAIGLLTLVDSLEFTQLFAAQILIGTGYALAAGGDSALIASTLSKGSDFDRVQRTAHIVVLVAVVMACVTGGWVAQLLGADAAIRISIVPPLLAAIVACAFSDRRSQSKEPSSKLQKLPMKVILRPELLVAIFNYGVSRAIFMSLFVAFIPFAFLVLFKVPLTVLGAIIGAYTLASILTASYSARICQLLGERLTVTISYILLIAAGLLLVYQGPLPALFYISPVLMGFAAGITRPLMIAQFSRQAEAHERGRVLSLAESMNGAFTILLILSICKAMDLYGIETGLKILAALITVLSLLTLTGTHLLLIHQNGGIAQDKIN